MSRFLCECTFSAPSGKYWGILLDICFKHIYFDAWLPNFLPKQLYCFVFSSAMKRSSCCCVILPTFMLPMFWDLVTQTGMHWYLNVLVYIAQRGHDEKFPFICSFVICMCPLRRYSIPFKFFVQIELYEFSLYFWQSLFRCVFCKYFSPVYGFC